MSEKQLRDFILNEVKKFMNEKIEKYSSFENDFKIGTKFGNYVFWKKNKSVYIDEKGIKHLMKSLKSIINAGVKSVRGNVNISDYDKDKNTINYNGVIIPTKIIEQLERIWVHEFGKY